ncbi:AI-2E family transporter [Faecalibacter rhinopitheci]|uniref:AI-2E family transporter n=1 Tax=Faecalibacter rhinopitheci TaxID=2779678 RepID=A0A8J7FQZ1_9FLAO|nr:AI-2E family transporter [Faecalibacter rhinopitheci]MBF0598199.1 AI-2E family transporter [Faecalibacter rhinopitheci]MBQ0147847.1 AI-2E family transporter [Candidatus Onthonaster equi]
MKSHKQYVSNNVLLQLGFLTLILIIFGLIIKNVFAFLPGILIAICLFVLLINPLNYLYITKKWNKTASVVLLMIASAVTIITPLYILIHMLTNKVMILLNDTNKIESDIKKAITTLNQQFNIDVFSETNISKLTQIGTKILQTLLNASLDTFIQLGVAFILLYFMLINHKKLEDAFYRYIPLKNRNLKNMNLDLKQLVISNTVGVPVTAFIQAIIAYIGYIIFGVDDSFTWFVLTIFAAMLPVVGAALIYIPLAIILIAQGETTNAIGLLLYSFIIVGLSDNLIRFVLQKKMADVHPLVTIFGVIIGINLFGFIGIIFGPILFSVFLWLIKLYKAEFVDPNPEEI